MKTFLEQPAGRVNTEQRLYLHNSLPITHATPDISLGQPETSLILPVYKGRFN